MEHAAMKLSSAARTDVGLKRAQNEDNFLLIPNLGLYILADGMGGHNSGQLASHLAVTLIAEFASQFNDPSLALPYNADPSLPFEANLLSNAIKHANERIFIESCKDRAAEGMGTTVTALLDTPQRIVIAHVGDSRVYRLRQNKLRQLTVDHSLANHLLSLGQLQLHEVANFAQKNVIMRAVGLKEYVEVDVQVIDKQRGDILMMCSDGLCDLVEDPHMEAVLLQHVHLEPACDQLIQMALAAGGKDNVTVVCVRVDEHVDAVSSISTQAAFSAQPVTKLERPSPYPPPAGYASPAPPVPPAQPQPSQWNRPLSGTIRRAPPLDTPRIAPNRLVHAFRQPQMSLREAIQRLISGVASALVPSLTPSPAMASPSAAPVSRPPTPPRGVRMSMPSAAPTVPSEGQSQSGSSSIRRARRTLQDIPTFADPPAAAAPPPVSSSAARAPAAPAAVRKPPPPRLPDPPDDDPVSEWDLNAIRADFEDDPNHK